LSDTEGEDEGGGVAIAPPGIAAENRAFDVTPATVVSAIVTDEGVARPLYDRSLPPLVHRADE